MLPKGLIVREPRWAEVGQFAEEGVMSVRSEVSLARPGAGWPRRYTLLALCFAAMFLCYIDRVNLSVAILAMQQTFGWSETVKGAVLSSFFVGYLIFQVPSGYLANRYGGRLVLGIAVLWWSLFTILTPVTAFVGLPLLLAARVALGLGEAATFPGAYNLFSRWIPTNERSRAVSILLSGIPLGTLFALVVTGWMVERFGWPSVFYAFGAAGGLWALVWFTRTCDDPAKDPRLSAEEAALLGVSHEAGNPHAGQSDASESGSANAGGQAGTTSAERSPAAGGTGNTIPWKSLFGSSAVWALVINHFCSNWGLYMLLTWLPSYFRHQGLSIGSAGLFSAAPWLTMAVMINVAAWIADRMVQAGVSLTVVRKTMQSVGLIGSALFLLLARNAATPEAALLLMCGALGALAFTWSGFAPNHLDIAPRHADVLMGVTNTAGTLPGIIGVTLTGWLVDVTGTYAAAFLLAAGLNLFGAAVWLAWGTGRRVFS